MNASKAIISLLTSATIGITALATDTPELLLKYDRPAQYFEEALVLGNGTLGASVYGGTSDLAMICECLIDARKAAKVLGVDKQLTARIDNAMKKIMGQGKRQMTMRKRWICG